MTEPRTGSTRTATAPRRPWWIWAIIALVVLVVLILLLVRCGTGGGAGNGTDPAAAPGSTPAAAAAATAPSAGAEPSAGATAGGPAAAPTTAPGTTGGTTPGAAPAAPGGTGTAAGSLTAGDTPLLPVAGAAGPNGELTALVGRPVSGRTLTVESVPADEGFWVGTDSTDRVFVQLTLPPGESPYQVRPGQQVDLDGTVAANDPGFAEQVGVDAAEGADQLTRQASHIDVTKADLRQR